jgi:LytS/YehU family sensor histidine kinase
MIPLPWTRYLRNGLLTSLLASFTLNFPQLMLLILRVPPEGGPARKPVFIISYPEYFTNLFIYFFLGFILFLTHCYMLEKNIKPVLRHAIIWIFAFLMINLSFKLHLEILDVKQEDIHGLAGYLFGQSLLVSVISVMSANVIYLIDRQREHQVQIEKLAAENIRSQYMALKSQVDPHFLFNSLNTLNTLIPQDPDRAQQYLNEMSNLMRHSLTQKENISLEDELSVARSYANLMNIRYGDALTFEFNVENRLLGSMIVPFSLQILLENVVKHNTITKAMPMNVRIFTQGNSLVVSNPIQPKKEPAQGEGIGLNNLSERYRLNWNRNIEITSDNKTFTVVLPISDLAHY